MTDKEVYLEFEQNSLAAEKRSREYWKEVKKTKRKEALHFENKKLGALFYALTALAGLSFILFLTQNLFIDERSKFYLNKILHSNPTSIVMFYKILPFIIAIIFIIICDVIKSVDNSIKYEKKKEHKH